MKLPPASRKHPLINKEKKRINLTDLKERKSKATNIFRHVDPLLSKQSYQVQKLRNFKSPTDKTLNVT